jgi:hypothetical protein
VTDAEAITDLLEAYNGAHPRTQKVFEAATDRALAKRPGPDLQAECARVAKLLRGRT